MPHTPVETTRRPARAGPRPPLALSIAAAAVAFAAAPPASADEVVVRNDSVEKGDTVAIQVGFIAGESAAAWLTAPCEGTIVGVQIFWLSLLGGEPPSLEESIKIHRDGPFPRPGAPVAELIGPVMEDGFLNEFRYLDENQQVPLSVPVQEGETFVVVFTFANDPPPLGPSIVTDIDGCQTPRNSIFAIPQGWLNVCLLGISGDFFIRAVVDCGGNVVGACCFENGACLDLTSSECEGLGGAFQGAGTTCADVECPSAREACCFPGGGCVNLPREDCVLADGVPQGPGTECADVDCTPEGACCFPNDFCLVLTEADCLKAGATWRGPDSDCADDDNDGTPDECEDCPEDVNGDGLVGFQDILRVLNAWGPCPDCPEDLDGSGAADFPDILLILSAWGPC